MKFFRVFIVCFLLSPIISFGQNSVALRFGINRFDLLFGAQYSRNFSQWQLSGSFDIGINRTIFQQRFFPKAGVATSYDFLENQNFFLGPQIQLDYFILNYNKLQNRPSHWCDFLGGIRFEYGKKWKLIFNAGMGPGFLWDFSVTEGRYLRTYFVNFESSIGCAYTF